MGLLVLADVSLWFFIFVGAPVDHVRYYFLNIGQGDSQLIIFPNNIKLLIDAGPDASVVRELGKVLPPEDRYIDLLLMTHPQLDHFGGFVDVLKNYQVGAFLGNGRRATIPTYGELMKIIRGENVPYITMAEGDKIHIGADEVDVLSPNPKDLASAELNDGCLITMVRAESHNAFYTCDAGSNIESELVQKYNLALAADILKVGHHGSRFSSSAEFLAAVHPKLAVIEVGAHNRYGHPTREALSRLVAAGTKIFRTDQDGTMLAEFADNSLRVTRVR